MTYSWPGLKLMLATSTKLHAARNIAKDKKYCGSMP